MSALDDREPDSVTIGVLLGGGEARRLGADKRGLRIGGATLLERNLALLQSIFPRVAVSLREGQDLGRAGCGIARAPEILTDRWSGSPLAAIATALDHFGEPVFVLACDLALAERKAIDEVLRAFRGVDLALPIVDDKFEPLHAVYGPGCLGPMRRLLERDRHRILDIAADVRVATVPFPTARPFFNINHPEDYERALRNEVERLVLDRARSAQRDADDSTVAAAASGSNLAHAADSGREHPVAPVGAPQPALVAIVGKSDSGKTTFIEKLLPELADLGLCVGTIKHDVHGFGVEMDTPGKDSWRHAQAGARATMIAGPDKIGFVERVSEPQPLTALVRRFFGGFDLVVAEGFKREAPHRIEIFRAGAGHSETLCDPGESRALVTDAGFEHPRRFALDDAHGVAELIAAQLDELRRY